MSVVYCFTADKLSALRFTADDAPARGGNGTGGGRQSGGAPSQSGRRGAVCELCVCVCPQLMTRLHAVVTEREAAGSPVELRLSQVAEELHSVIAEHIEVG